MDSEAIEATAARWLIRRHGDTWTPDSQTEFETWLNESPYHRVAYIRLEATWRHTARLEALGAGVPAGHIPPPKSWSIGLLLQTAADVGASEKRSMPAPPLGWIAIAATLVLALVAGVYLIVLHLQRPQEYATAVGGLRTIHLPDESAITLNTNTHIRVYLGTRERRVDLDSGEAFFVIARDRARPFVVHVADKRITAVGTEFAVRRLDADVQVLVSTGRVRLASSLSQPFDQTTTLEAGTVARTVRAEIRVQPAAAAQIEQLLGWRAGFVIFHDTQLAEALGEFNRYRAQPVVIADPSITAIRIGGKFRTNNIDAFLELLQQGFPVSVERNSNTIVLKRVDETSAGRISR